MDQSNSVKLTFDPRNVFERYGRALLMDDYNHVEKLLNAQRALIDVEDAITNPQLLAAVKLSQKMFTESIDVLFDAHSKDCMLGKLISTTMRLIGEVTNRTVHQENASFYIYQISQVELFEVNTKLREAGYHTLVVRQDWSNKKATN